MSELTRRIGNCSIIALCIIVFMAIMDWQTGFHLLGGWLWFLAYTLPQVRVRIDGVIFFVAGLAVCVLLVQWLMTWFLDARAQTLGRTTSARWRWRHSCALLGLFLMMFVIVTAMAGLTHQVGWLMRSPIAWYTTATQSEQDNLLSEYRMGVIDPNRTGRSWIGDIAPYLPVMIENVDDKLPWNAPTNVHQYRKVCPNLFTPRASMPHKSPDGFGLNHFAGNSAILMRDKPLRLKDVEVGETILVGEVNQGLVPWGMPGNCRSADAGINKVGPKPPGVSIGFGTPAASNVTEFGMLDGSVRTISADIDPAVLKQLGQVKPIAN